MSQKIKIDVDLLNDLVEAAGWVGTYHNMFVNGETSENCGDLNAAEYLASEAGLIEQRGRAVLEAAEHSYAADGGYCLHCKVNGVYDGCCINCMMPAATANN